MIEKNREQRKEFYAANPGAKLSDFSKSDINQAFKKKYRELDDEIKSISERIAEYNKAIQKEAEQKHNDVLKEKAKEFYAAVEASGLSEENYRREKIIQDMGTTTLPEHGGYIFPDGEMIKMGDTAIRDVDHRFVVNYFSPDAGFDKCPENAKWAFIAEGNIRWMPEGPGISIDVNQPMTTDQKMTLYDALDYAKQTKAQFYVDVFDKGERVQSFFYEGAQINMAKISMDLKNCTQEYQNSKNNKEMSYDEMVNQLNQKLSEAKTLVEKISVAKELSDLRNTANKDKSLNQQKSNDRNER
ncbi:MAG: hypothetical protein UIM53_06090 [Acutalibacteraceae bacterium]|nr:hypothetical protein [Acutalibacteraceae bacterium]